MPQSPTLGLTHLQFEAMGLALLTLGVIGLVAAIVSALALWVRFVEHRRRCAVVVAGSSRPVRW